MATKQRARQATFGDYLSGAGDLPEEAFVGSLLWFTVTKKARVTPADVEQRFAQFNLDPRYVPSLIAPANAFRKATGPEAREAHYMLADGHEARVLLRSLPSTREDLTRIVVRERIDASGKTLEHVEVGRIVFYKQDRKRGVGSERVRFTLHDHILQDGERDSLKPYMDKVYQDYETFKSYLYDQPLRQMVREYVEGLNAVSVRPSGGLYFIHRSRWDEVRRLAEMVRSLHPDCAFVTSPLVDLPEMREMLIDAFQDEIVDEVTKLVEAIEVDRKAGKAVKAEDLAKYSDIVRTIASRAEEHTRVLEVSQDRTAGALEGAYAVLAGLASQIEG